MLGIIFHILQFVIPSGEVESACGFDFAVEGPAFFLIAKG
jgi:hypothetical protein